MQAVRCAIALGSNLGNSRTIVEDALSRLAQKTAIAVSSHSSWYKTAPVGPPQPDYINGCAILDVQLSPQALLEVLLEVEKQWGRVRRERWGPRTLDLDLLLFGDLILDTPSLQIPHPRMRERAFVLVPLAEIAPEWIDPVTGMTIAQLLEAVDCSGVYPLTTSMSDAKEPPHILKQRLLYQGRKFNFDVNHLRLPNGTEGDWECIRHPGGALGVPVTREGQLVLVRQYRFAVQGRLLEFPAGTIESDENPLLTIQREIEEETGYRANEWKDLGRFPIAPGYSDEYIYAFLARDLEKLDHPPAQDEDEDIEVVLMTPDEFEDTARSRDLIDGKSITSYFLARPFLNSNI
jgi:ADP-ribose pyrophosphatase